MTDIEDIVRAAANGDEEAMLWLAGAPEEQMAAIARERAEVTVPSGTCVVHGDYFDDDCLPCRGER